jgi:uncharacterized protein DUF6493
VERVLDGTSRLCDWVPFDFAAGTGLLQARAQQPEQLSWRVMRPICDLALAWITGKPRDVMHANLFGSFTGIFARRVLAIARRAAARQSVPMLSAPTHLGGWIDPRVLVERVKLCASLPVRADRLDGSFALLRLAPDAGPRAEALRAASNLAGPRLTKALADAARVSPLHAHVVAQALQIAIVDLLPPPRDLHVALELLKELLVETGQRLSAPGIKEYVRGLSVSGKTAKLTRDLLGIEVNADNSSRRAAATQALAGRARRAERWMQCRRGAEDNHESRALRVEPRKPV